MNANIGYLYYKDFYRDENNVYNLKDSKLLGDKYNYIEKLCIKENTYSSVVGEHEFTLKTLYPGLLIGSGYSHGIDSEEDFKLGFYFDYTSGLPVIPGSSIKGVLRSAFMRSRDYIKELLQNNEIKIEYLEKEIFDGIVTVDGAGKNTNIYDRDIFFDAFPNVVKNSKSGILMSDDYITPHRDELKNPTPIRFIKVNPGVYYNFRFSLKNGIISAEQKRELFRKILLDLGLGAKTNVGYGGFTSDGV